MKTETTKRLERMLLSKFDGRKDFYVFECTIGWYGHEIVDCISYNVNREITCFEIKQSISDFHSKNAVTFIGDKNYYVMPVELYEKVKYEVPMEIGVYVACKREEYTEEDEKGHLWHGMREVLGFDELYCIKPCKKRLLRADKEVILSSMLRCACRDRYRGGVFPGEEEAEIAP